MASDDVHRLHTNDLEIGATEAVQQHFARHVVGAKPVSQRKLDFEHSRPRWLREMAAEATGVFFYVFPGIASVATFTLNLENPLGVTAFSSLFQIGWGFAIGIAFAIITCAPTSGGHFNPAITICFAIWQGFPWKKVPYYIFAQIFGAFIAGLLVVGMYWPEIQAYKAASLAKGLPLVANGGVASILCTFPNPTQNNLGYLFFIEFFVDSFIGIVIWACLDPANPFVSPISIPFVIGLAYASMVWGFADISISTNLARDLGTRIVAAIFFGGEAFSYKNYSWIAILVNIPATIFAVAYYEMLMRDSLQKISKGHATHEGGEEGLHRHLTNTGIVENGATSIVRGHQHGADEAVGKVDIILRGRIKSQVTIESTDANGERRYTTYRGRATLFEYIEPVHRGYPDHFILPVDRHEWPYEFIFPDTALPVFGATPCTESEHYAHRPGHALPPSFSTKHDGGRSQKNTYICYELEAVLTRPASTSSFLKLPLKCRVDLQFSPSCSIEDPDPNIYCEEQTFTRQSRRLDPSTARRSLSLKERARALCAHGDQPKATFAIKVGIPQVGCISGPLDIFVGIEHDPEKSTFTALPLVYLKRVRLRLPATTYAHASTNLVLVIRKWGRSSTPTSTFSIICSQRRLWRSILNMMQLCPALQVGRHLTPTFSTYNLAREYRSEVKVTMQCA